jgi:SAM-dependent methyltransferase
MPAAYEVTQKRSRIGSLVNDAGYRVLSRVELQDREVLEIGPGEITHIERWNGLPRRYTIADIRPEMLERARIPLQRRRIACREALLPRGASSALPFDPAAFDVIVAFYSLEHMHPLPPHLDELVRVLRPGGLLVGAIPAEGGLAWGTGRYLTTRRWFKKHTSIDPDKIICWEHPNFAGSILRELDRRLRQQHLSFWPLRLPALDFNLVARFVYQKA